MTIGLVVLVLAAAVGLRIAGKTAPASLLGKWARFLRIVSHDAADAAIRSTDGGDLRDAIRQDREALAQSTVNTGGVAAEADRLRTRRASAATDLTDLRGLLAQQLRDGREVLAGRTAESIARLEEELKVIDDAITRLESSYGDAVQAIADADEKLRSQELEGTQLTVEETVLANEEITDRIIRGGGQTDEALRRRADQVADARGRARARRDVDALSTDGQLREYRSGQRSARAEEILAEARRAASPDAPASGDAPTA